MTFLDEPIKLEDNVITLTDSYKYSHWRQYPRTVSRVFSYLSSRGGVFPETVSNAMLFYQLQKLTGKVVTQEKIEAAAKISERHFKDPTMFNRKGWEHILNKHDGRLPLKIRAVPEGTLVPTGNVLLTAENTDPLCPWLTSYFEPFLVQNWYPTTVATYSYHVKKVIAKYLEETGTPETIGWKFHDFGVRGSSSFESARIGGAAHLMCFEGTDNVPAMELLETVYGASVGDSIPAAEHSTVTSWISEKEFFQHMLDEFPGMVAVVSDTYDIFEACRNWSDHFKEQILSRDGTLVIRPDSGDPLEVLYQVFSILFKGFGYETNSKGYKVLPPQVRVIQGDGVNLDAVDAILAMMKRQNWSADNIAFGCGGGLLQKHNRDTNRFAFKASAVFDNGEWREIRKKPITDPGKISLAGLLDLVQIEGEYVTTKPSENSLLETVYENGKVRSPEGFNAIRALTAV